MDLSDNNFKKNKDGETVFYPWGILSKGYVIKDNKVEKSIRDFMKSWLLSFAASFFIIAFIFKGSTALILLPIFFLCFHFKTKKLVADMPLNTTRIKLKDHYREVAAKRSKPVLWISSLAALAFLFLCLLMLSSSNSIFDILIFGIGTLYSGVFSIACFYMLAIRKPNNSIQADAAEPRG